MIDPALRHSCECTLCQEKTDEIDRLRKIAIERMDLFKQAANNVEQLDAEVASLRAQLTGCGGDVKACTSDVPCAFGALAQIENLRAQLASARKALAWIKANKGAHPGNIVAVIEECEREVGCSLTDEKGTS